MGELKAKKKFGQNFIIDSNTVEKIAKTACDPNLTTLEIGHDFGVDEENLGFAHTSKNPPLVTFWVENWRKGTHFFRNTSKIIAKIASACTNLNDFSKNVKVYVALMTKVFFQFV